LIGKIDQLKDQRFLSGQECRHFDGIFPVALKINGINPQIFDFFHFLTPAIDQEFPSLIFESILAGVAGVSSTKNIEDFVTTANAQFTDPLGNVGISAKDRIRFTTQHTETLEIFGNRNCAFGSCFS
jgi:hypothetical protein